MKKLLLAGVAAFAMTSVATPASAEGVKLELGGFAKAYGVFLDQDENGGTDVRDFDIIRDTEIHFSGENVLDNGLTIGFHAEVEADSNNSSSSATAATSSDSLDIEENYLYFSGGWGRVNAGAENGAAYLLQVAAPSADSNVDGLRTYVQPFNYSSMFSGASGTLSTSTYTSFDYENVVSGYSEKLTYLSPVFGGFQAGLSYTPDANSGNDFQGASLDDQAGGYGDIFEIAARYEGQLDAIGFAFGAGYTNSSLEAASAGTALNGVAVTLDDRTEWNVGLDLDVGAFGLGVVYTEDDLGYQNTANIDDQETLVVGVDYTTGAFKLGASYFSQDNTAGIQDFDTDRYTGGVVYTYGPGMTFRGSVSYIEHENVTGLTGDVDGTAVLLGTQIKF